MMLPGQFSWSEYEEGENCGLLPGSHILAKRVGNTRRSGWEEGFRGERGAGQDCAPKMFSRAELNSSGDGVPLICAPKKQLEFIWTSLSKKGTSLVLRRKGSNG